jgi:hypothetical protein
MTARNVRICNNLPINLLLEFREYKIFFGNFDVTHCGESEIHQLTPNVLQVAINGFFPIYSVNFHHQMDQPCSSISRFGYNDVDLV